MENNIEEFKILVTARASGFWTTPIREQYFPNAVLLPARPSRWQKFVGVVRTFVRVIQERPHVLVCGTSSKMPVIFSTLRKYGVFRHMRIVTDDQFMHLTDLSYIDRVIVYSPDEVLLFKDEWRQKITSTLYPSKVELVDVTIRDEGYIFAGGNHLRDHDSFLRAMEQCSAPAELYTSNELSVPAPPHVTVHGQVPLEEYYQRMAGAHFVVIPLQGNTKVPHGHCDISTALSMGKVVVTTRQATADSYIEEGYNSILVEPGSVEGYRKAIKSLLDDPDKLARMSAYAKEHTAHYRFEAYAEKMHEICKEVAAAHV